MSRVFQRPGRGGYYLAIAVPRELRKKLRKSEIISKLGNKYKEDKNLLENLNLPKTKEQFQFQKLSMKQ